MALRTIRKRYIVIPTILVIFIAGFLLRDSFYTQLTAWKIVQKPEETTELYFTQPGSIPVSYAPAQPIAATFTIRNNTNTVKNYHYTVQQVSETGDITQALKNDTLVIGPQGQKDTMLRLTPLDLGTRTQFIIRLADQPQRINFWVTKS